MTENMMRRILSAIPLVLVLSWPAYGVDLAVARKPTEAAGRDTAARLGGSSVRLSNLERANQRLAAESMRAGIDFVGRTDRLAPGSNRRLMALTTAIVEAERDLPDLALVVVVEGHTDDSGNDLSDKELSDHRAMAVARELIAKGIPKDNCIAVGYGSSQPLVVGTTPAQRAKNNRILVRLEEKGRQ